MPIAKVALDGKVVRLEPLEERHRELVRPAAQHPEIFTITTSALGPLYDPYIDNALKRSDGVHDLAFAVLHKPTGRHVEVPLVAIVNFRGDKLYHEHIYWDQASVLAQIGLIDAKHLPVAGVETAKKLVDETLPSNTLMKCWAESAKKG